MWAEDDLELLAVLSLLQNAGITGVLHRAGTVKRAEFKKIQTQEFSFHSFCLCFPSRVLSVLQSHPFGE